MIKNKKPTKRRTLVLERETITHLSLEALKVVAGADGSNDSISFCRPCGPPPG